MSKIILEYIYPPIPDRSCDWSAVRDDYDGAPDSRCPRGLGPTPEAALADLLEQELLRAEDLAERLA